MNMKKLFLFLLKRYGNTESGRMEIYKHLWYKTKEDYPEQNVFGNFYNMNVEVIMSNPFFAIRAQSGAAEDLKKMKENLSQSFDDSIHFVRETVIQKGDVEL